MTVLAVGRRRRAGRLGWCCASGPRSDLWLDEALTVNIARLPLHLIPSFLQRDGAPPLYYVLLHFWIGWFGTSDVAVRSLSGVIGRGHPPAGLAGRASAWRAGRWPGPPLLLVATSPFAIRYDTETRMYSLVMLLTVLGFLALDRSLRRPRPGNLVAVAAVTGAPPLLPLLVDVPDRHGDGCGWPGRPGAGRPESAAAAPGPRWWRWRSGA